MHFCRQPIPLVYFNVSFQWILICGLLKIRNKGGITGGNGVPGLGVSTFVGMVHQRQPAIAFGDVCRGGVGRHTKQRVV